MAKIQLQILSEPLMGLNCYIEIYITDIYTVSRNSFTLPICKCILTAFLCFVLVVTKMQIFTMLKQQRIEAIYIQSAGQAGSSCQLQTCEHDA